MAAVKSQPYQAYAAIIGTFVGGLGAAGVLARSPGRDPVCQTSLDLVVLSAASFKAARTLAHDEVTSFLRDPFVKCDAHEGDEDPPTGDYRQVIGELVTCSRCGGTWAAAALASTQILAPRFGRLLTWSPPLQGSTTGSRPASRRSPSRRTINPLASAAHVFQRRTLPSLLGGHRSRCRPER